MAPIFAKLCAVFILHFFASAESTKNDNIMKTRSNPSTNLAEIYFQTDTDWQWGKPYVYNSVGQWVTICLDHLNTTARHQLGIYICQQQQQKYIESINREVSCEETTGNSIQVTANCWSEADYKYACKSCPRCFYNLPGRVSGCCKEALEVQCSGTKNRTRWSHVTRLRRSTDDYDDVEGGLRSLKFIWKIILPIVGSIFICCSGFCCCKKCRDNDDDDDDDDDDYKGSSDGTYRDRPLYRIHPNPSSVELLDCSGQDKAKDGANVELASEDKAWTSRPRRTDYEDGMGMQQSSLSSDTRGLPPPPPYKEALLV